MNLYRVCGRYGKRFSLKALENYLSEKYSAFFTENGFAFAMRNRAFLRAIQYGRQNGAPLQLEWIRFALWSDNALDNYKVDVLCHDSSGNELSFTGRMTLKQENG